MRSNRVRSLLGLHDAGGVGGGDVVDENRTNNAINGETGGGGGRRGIMNENSGGGGKRTTTTLAEEMMIDTEAAVMANFEFLASEVRLLICYHPFLFKIYWCLDIGI